MARAKARFGPDSARSEDRVIGLVACGLFGLGALIKRRKGRGERVHDDVAQGEKRISPLERGYKVRAAIG